MTALDPTETKSRLKMLGLFGLLACCDQIADKPWLPEVLAIEERERHKRSLERRIRNSRVATFKPMADFDWSWPKKIDREAVDELFTLAFIKSGHNAVLVGPNGVGKTMILKNVAHQAVVRGHTVRFATASDMLADLAAQDSSAALARRLRRYTIPQLLCVDSC
jgi:DNA replication protein DnaC